MTARSERASAAYQGSALAQANRARRVGAGLAALRMPEEASLRTLGYGQPATTLEAYWAMHGADRDNAAGKLVDAGREPYLVNSEALERGLHPLVEIWDIGIDKVPVGTGKRYSGGKADFFSVTTRAGDALLPADTLVLWR